MKARMKYFPIALGFTLIVGYAYTRLCSSTDVCDGFGQGIFVELHGVAVEVLLIYLIINRLSAFQRERNLAQRIRRHLQALSRVEEASSVEVKRNLISQLSMIQAAKNERIESVILRNADFSGENLGGFSFVSCDFRGAKFSFASLERCQFIGCDLQGAEFGSALLNYADLSSSENLTVGQVDKARETIGVTLPHAVETRIKQGIK